MVDGVDPTLGVRTESMEIMREMAESLKSLPLVVDAIKTLCHQQEPQPVLTEVERGLLLVLRLKNPTQRTVAQAMGLKHHSGLRKYPVVIEAIRRWQLMKTVTGGSGRSVTDHTMADDSEY